MIPHEILAIPRWEWRMLRPSLADIRERIAGVPIEKVREIHETYLLCLRSSHNAKIRGQQLDLKWRLRTNPQELELWHPVLKSGFPLEGALIRQLFWAWALPPPDLSRERYGMEAFLREIIAPNLHLLPLPVDKVRRGFTLEGATCEWVELNVGAPARKTPLVLESFCVEHEDPGVVLEVLRRLDLLGLPNTNYPKGLKAALASRIAS